MKRVESKDLPSCTAFEAVPCNSVEDENASKVAEVLDCDVAVDMISKQHLISDSNNAASLLSHAATNQLVVWLFCNNTTLSCRHASMSREKGTFVQIIDPANLPTKSKKAGKRAHTP